MIAVPNTVVIRTEMADQDIRELLTQACHILYNEGQEHFYLGHVSVRDGEHERMWVKPSGIGLGEVRPEDLALVDFEGRKLEGPRPIHHEMPIHIETYKRRPDVRCVVHTHPFYAAAFSAASAKFEMVSQDSVLFANGVGFYPSAALVVTPEQGSAMAVSLGSQKAVILKNHGCTVVGPSVQDATFLAVSLDRSLRMQLAAGQLGPVSAISPAEVQVMNDYFDRSYHGRVQTTWEYLLRKAERARAAGLT